jgi:beta-lactamase superfamily II metal-dependent hydrolase
LRARGVNTASASEGVQSMHHALLVAAGEATRTVLVRAPTEPIRAVVFDVGETIVDETRAWSQLADPAGVTRLTLVAALGALIERGDDHRRKEITLKKGEKRK